MPLTRNAIYEFGPFRLDIPERRLLRENRPLPLRAKVFDTLSVLVEHAGTLVSKDELMQAVWSDATVEEGNLAHNITVLRKILGEKSGGLKYIETVSGKGYRFVAGVSVRPVSASLPPQHLRPPELVARDQELQVIHQALDDAAAGTRHTICITGEAGIGKTTLLKALLAEAAARGFRVGRGQCLEGLGEGEPYMPVLEGISQLCRVTGGGDPSTVLERVAPTWIPHLPWLSLASASDLAARTLGATRERMLREFAEAMETLSADKPLVLAFEDLHWSDASTIQLMSMMAMRTAPARILMVGTYRPKEAELCGLHIHSMTQQLKLRGLCSEVSLHSLQADGVRELLALRLPGATLTSDLVAITRKRSEGIPLFVEALVDHWRSTGFVTGTPGQWSIERSVEELDRGVPESLRSMILSKVDSLDENSRNIIEAASVCGVEFSAASVAAAAGIDVDNMEKCLDTLARQGTIIVPAAPVEWPDGAIAQGYRFGHSLYQETVYERIPAGRRARLHQGVGSRLERAYGSSAAERAAELAHHFVRAGDTARAVPHLLAAAGQALHRSAHREVIELARRGLRMLGQLPDDTLRLSLELGFQAMLAPTLVRVEGFASPEAEHAYNRAVELGISLERTDLLFSLMFGQAAMHELRGDFDKSERVLHDRLELLQDHEDSGVVVTSDALMACSLFHQGRFSGALAHANRGSSAYDPSKHLSLIAPYGETPGAACDEVGSLATWFLGYPDRALERIESAVKLVRSPDHAFSVASVLVRASLVHQLRGESECALRTATEARQLAEARGYGWVGATAVALAGWVSALDGDFSELQHGLEMLAAIGAHLDRPFFLGLLADALTRHGKPAEAQDAIVEALRHVGPRRTHFYQAELHRLKGRSALNSGDKSRLDEAEAAVREALRIAREQQAKSLELRAAVDLCTICRRRGKIDQAEGELAEVYAWFTEGFDTLDLTSARRVLSDHGLTPLSATAG